MDFRVADRTPSACAAASGTSSRPLGRGGRRAPPRSLLFPFVASPSPRPRLQPTLPSSRLRFAGGPLVRRALPVGRRATFAGDLTLLGAIHRREPLPAFRCWCHQDLPPFFVVSAARARIGRGTALARS